jgi:hypothetical protein
MIAHEQQHSQQQTQQQAPQPPSRLNLRQVFFSEEMGDRLEARKQDPGIPISTQVRLAIERYLMLPPERAHRLLVTRREVRKPANIPGALWNALKQRKKDTGLDLNEQVQIAVTLYLQNLQSEAAPRAGNENGESSIEISSKSSATGDDLQLTPPPEKARKSKPVPSAEEELRLRRLIDEAFEQKTAGLLDELRAQGHDVRAARPAALQLIKKVPRTMMVSCGDGDELDNIVEILGEASEVEIGGVLATKVTPRSVVAIANGWSMSHDGSRLSIQSGDEVLLTPLDEYTQSLKKGAIVLAEIEFQDGRVVQTLKAYEGRRLKANNPKFAGFELGPTMKTAVIKAVCRGVLEKVFD